MNLHQYVSSYISAVNPPVLCGLRSSIGTGPTDAAGSRPPKYATPGALVGSIAALVLTATAVSQGVLQPGQTLFGAGIDPAQAPIVTAQLTGQRGGVGTYAVSRALTVASVAMSTATMLWMQVQPMTNRDLLQLEGLNLGGEKKAVYTSGDVAGVVRVELKGGDLLDLPDGSVWLVNQTLEDFNLTAGWTKFAITLQDGA